MSMADTIAVMNRGKIEQAGSATDLYERPTDGLRRQVPRHLEPDRRRDRRDRRDDGERHDARRRRAARARQPLRRARRHAGPDRRPPREGAAVEGRARRRRRATTSCAGGWSSSSFLGVSLQYVIKTAGGEELTVYCQNEDGSPPTPSAQARRCSSPGIRATPSSSRGVTTVSEVDPERFGHELDRFFEQQRLSRRRFLGRGAATVLMAGGLAQVLAACGIDGTAARNLETCRRRRSSQPSENRAGRLDLLELAALHRQVGDQGVQLQVRRPLQVRRGDQRQQRVLRQGPSAARGRGPDRARHRHADRLHGLALGPLRLRHADRQEQRAEQQTARRNLRSISYDPRRQFTLPWPVGRDRHRLRHQADRRRGEIAQRAVRPQMEGPRHDLLRALRLRRQRAADGRGRRQQSVARPDARRDRENRQGQRRRPVPSLHRQRLHDRSDEGQHRARARLLGRPRSAAERQPEHALRLSRRGGDAVHRQHDDAVDGRASVRRRDDDELPLRPGGGGRRSAPRSTTSRRSTASRRSSREPIPTSPETS